MIIGVPREIKIGENRVGMLPSGVQMLVEDGHKVLVEKGAGLGSGINDRDYISAGARIVKNAEEIYKNVEMIVKVKEPQPSEIKMLRRGQIVFCYFHFAADKVLTRGCLKAGIIAIAYETLQDEHGRLPLLTPMSEVAGKMSVQIGARLLEKLAGGRGVLLGGVAGVEPANVLVVGAGVVGECAARVAAGMGANVVALDNNLDRIRYLEDVMPANVRVLYSDPHIIESYAEWADLLIGAVLLPGRRAPVLIKRSTLKKMKEGAVIVDVAIDQGGCCETSRPTTHENPTYVVDGVLHYCVTNIPALVSRTSTYALCNATFPYCREIANEGVTSFANKSPGRAFAINMKEGKIVNKGVAETYPDLAGL
jgi:alanine dehydrogenase